MKSDVTTKIAIRAAVTANDVITRLRNKIQYGPMNVEPTETEQAKLSAGVLTPEDIIANLRRQSSGKKGT